MLVKQQQQSVYYSILENHKIGEVHDGAATMDWMAQEQEEVLLLLLQLVNGISNWVKCYLKRYLITLILSILRDTLTLQ
jgi:hypothetical protein